MVREPEPLERVRALVCEFCWVNCFDTEGFEKLGRGDINEFEYEITGENVQTGTKTGCTWCSTVDQIFLRREWAGNTFKIGLSAKRNHVITPPGSNFYEFHLKNELEGTTHRTNLEFFTEHDNLAAQQVTARDVDPDVTPSKTSSNILRWLKECVQHSCCPQQIGSPLPTRLIDVTTARICDTNGSFDKFVALSYCWGSGSQIQLRSDTIETLMHHMDFNDLPQTIKDAVLVTRSLSIRYLWVDALCIIQDDAEDKAREIGSMAKIYSNAYITILASNASDAAHGFLATCVKHEARNARIPFRIAPNKFGSITTRKYARRPLYIKEGNPLSTRAWALQEQMMASRILAYTKHTLEWRCASGAMNLNESLNVEPCSEPVPKLISQLSTNPEEALFEWSRVLEDYSHRSMSIQSDKLPAIAALAERFAAVLGRYHAGLWPYGLIRQLCWASNYHNERPDDLYRAPSWSWASVGPIFSLSENRDEDCCSLVSVKVLPENAAVPYGEVVHASMKIFGKVIIASISKETESTARASMCTLIHPESRVTESALQRFYNTYFHQDTDDAVSGQVTTLETSWDYKEFRGDPLVVLLLPLRRGWRIGISSSFSGLILIPAGPGVVRRIGMFRSLNGDKLGNAVNQEITIV